MNEEYSDRVRQLLGREVLVVIDRPLGSSHPKYPDLIYSVNYGYVEEFLAPDGDYQDAYVLGVDEPVKAYSGVVIAIVRRLDDVEDKLIVAPSGVSFHETEIEEAIAFQERFFKHVLIR